MRAAGSRFQPRMGGQVHRALGLGDKLAWHAEKYASLVHHVDAEQRWSEARGDRWIGKIQLVAWGILGLQSGYLV